MTKRTIGILIIGSLIAIGLYGCITRNTNTTINGRSTTQVNSGLSVKSMKSNLAIPTIAPDMPPDIPSGESDMAGSNVQTPTTETNSGQVTINSHKIIQTGDISMETLKFDDSVLKAKDYVKSIGGYANSSTVQGQGIDSQNNERKRTANFEFRIPSSEYNNFFTQIKDYGVVTSEQSNGQDITENYIDTEARVKSLQIQEDRELELVKTATKLSDIIELERELNNVRYQIESYTGTLKKWDSLVDYSTIRLTITEVDESVVIEPQKTQGLWSRMAYSFTESTKNLATLAENLVIMITAIIPFAIVLVVLYLVVYLIRRKLTKHKKIENKTIDAE